MLYLIEKLAKALIGKYHPKIICITGSVGKTSTRNAIAASLTKVYTFRSTPKNLNNSIGVPLSVIGNFNFKGGLLPLIRMVFLGIKQLLPNSSFPSILVLEIGAGKVGDIRRISSWLKPDYLVITNLPNQPSHLGEFGSKEAIVKEKKYLADVMTDNGKMVIDEAEINLPLFIIDFQGTIITYNSCDSLKLIDYEVIYDGKAGFLFPVGIRITVTGLTKKRLELNYEHFLGSQNIKAIIPAIILAKELKISDDDMNMGLETYNPEPGRLRLLKGKAPDVTIIDDSYNASPKAVENSLKTFIGLKKRTIQRKIAILGDMLNLGPHSEIIHQQTAMDELPYLDILITVGNDAIVWQSSNKNTLGYNRHFKNATNAAHYVEQFMVTGDLILCKGGYLLRLEKAVKILANCDPKDLVRQEDYWQKKEYELYGIECDD